MQAAMSLFASKAMGGSIRWIDLVHPKRIPSINLITP